MFGAIAGGSGLCESFHLQILGIEDALHGRFLLAIGNASLVLIVKSLLRKTRTISRSWGLLTITSSLEESLNLVGKI
jgi:hypothetical protein